MNDMRVLCCWDCHKLVEEVDAYRVRANPHMPAWMSTSTTLVCARCWTLRDPEEGAV